MGRTRLALIILAGVLMAHDALAGCQFPNCHSDGAVLLPGSLNLALPFKAGEKVRVLSGYGPDAGSSLHCRAKDATCANDYYALDLVLDGQPNFGKGRPVLAVAAGKVIAAGWGSDGWVNYGRRVYVRHTPGEGHEYVSMYAHLDSISVAVGAKVEQGAELGTLGQSCGGASSDRSRA